MNIFRIIAVTIAWLVFLSSLLFAQTSATTLFNRGNEFYKNNEFGKAAEEYDKILDLGVVNGQVYFNLGNAYFKKGKVGKAVLYYEKALKLFS